MEDHDDPLPMATTSGDQPRPIDYPSRCFCHAALHMEAAPAGQVCPPYRQIREREHRLTGACTLSSRGVGRDVEVFGKL